MISLQDIFTARKKMRDIVHMTPLDYSATFSELSKNEVFLKLENLQKTGSFKVRGSYNKMMALPKEDLQKGVIAASAGNHAQGVAYSSRMLGIPCTIIMPKGAPLSKVLATRRYGANVELHGDVFDEALAYAKELHQQTGATFVHAFDDNHVIAGQGTVGLEILEQLSDVDAVVCPVGGGGLLAGVAMAIKEQKPSVKLYGVQALACPSMKQSLQEKKLLTVESTPTMADGIAVKRPGELTFDLVQRYVDDIVCVDEMEIARTMLMVLERSKLLVEGSGASGLASLLYEKLPLQGKKVVAVLSGGNVDVNFISRIIERGMVEAGRFIHIATTVKDKPGELQKILRVIADLGANVLNIHHERMGMRVFPGYAELHLSLETRDQAHIERVLQVLKDKAYDIQVLE
ncbi:threonine ammonia-lyase [Ectobacillus ponti]|uniref:threonine ammonia-lyase n=1 Tax=Ectobacillus ponti TaxID=2961894 RepID=A0AA41X6Z9_9BACI|nr:threonine ammonia-lyase [Ectobacillus ponti]MCP8969877.1 threonine ammonia-lyase [Ectobacillus ponti]